MKEGTRVLVALGIALGVGIAISMSGSDQLLRAADFITPVGTIWVNAIRMTVIPLVVSLLVVGIASSNDLGAIGKLGVRTVIVFLVLLLGVAAISVPVAPLIFTLLPDGARPALPTGAEEAAGQLAAAQPQTLASWLTSLVPTNPIAAAASGSMIQLIIFTLFFAVAITRIEPGPREAVLKFFTAISDAMLVLVRWVVWLAPIGIVALVLPLAAHAGASLVGAIGFYIVVYSAMSIVVVLLLYPVVAIFGGIPMAKFARAALPAQTVAFSSSSSIASLPALVDSAERALGMPTHVTGFVLPFAVSTFKLVGPVAWTVGALFVGWFYNVPLHAQELATIAFAAVFLSFAAPGVPRGAFIMLTPLFLAVGLPAAGIGILIAVDAIPDTFATVTNVTGDLAACAIVSNKATQQQRNEVDT